MPSSFVTAVSAPIWAGEVAVTLTPGNTSPLPSTTCPLMLPVELAPPPCARMGDALANTRAHAHNSVSHAFFRVMAPPSS